MAKIVRDLVYGYLALDQPLVDIIDTPWFQRLKRVRQLTSQDVFPSTNHTRYEHSLGVLELGREALAAACRNSAQCNGEQMGSFRPTIEAALLLHDVGHAPFSHLCEQFYSRDQLLDELRRDGFALRADCAPHEAMSALIAVRCFGPQLDAIGVDRELLCRMITGSKYRDPQQWPSNVAIELLSSPIDVDKLDYVVRDNHMTGGQIAALDHERIASSYTVNEHHLVLSSSALSAVVNMVHGRDTMYVWVYNHHTTVYVNTLASEFIAHLIDSGRLDPATLFSFQGITTQLTDDADVIYLMKLHRATDDRCASLFRQLFHRDHHAALWKSPYDFETLVDSDSKRDRIIVEGGERPEEFAQRIRDAARIGRDDLYVGRARHKPFTPVAAENIYLAPREGSNKQFTQFFLESPTRALPKEMPYIFFNPEVASPDDVLNAVLDQV